MTLHEVHEKLRAALTAAKGICDAAEQGKREFTEDERTKLAAMLEEAKGLKEQVKKLEGDAEMTRMIAEMGVGLAQEQKTGQAPTVPAARGRKMSIGEQFVNAAEFKEWMAKIAPNGRIPEGMRGLMSPAVEFKALITGASDTSAGAFVETDYTGIYEGLGRLPRSLLQLVNRRTTLSDLVEFVRQTAQVTQAVPVAEANVTDYTGATGEVSGEKPEGTSTWAKVQATVKTIAVWIPATKRALADAAQLRGIIDQELRDDLDEELENQLINGDGVGENFDGILGTAGVLTQAWDTDIFTTTRRAKTAVMTTGRAMPSAYVMNPGDWETIELSQDLAGRYYYGGPLSNGEKRLWGIPVVECNALAEGQIILGDWRKAVLWDRERSTIQVSDSHADFFIRNMIAILAEMRAAFGLIRPSAFCIIDAAVGS